MEDWFAKTDLIEFEIRGQKFKYKPTTAGQDIDSLNKTLIFNHETGKYESNLAELNKMKLLNIMEAPFKDYDKLNDDKKIELFCSLKRIIVQELLEKIELIEQESNEIVKN